LLVQTLGIVLSSLRYRESSLIVRVYTESAGLQSLIVNSVRTAKPAFPMAFFQPLSLIDLVFYQKPNNNALQRLKEVHTSVPFKYIGTDQVKTCLAFFMAEVLEKAIKEEEGNEPMFQLLWTSCQILDLQETGSFLFLQQFMVRLASNLGFGIDNVNAFYSNVAKADSTFSSTWEYHIDPDEVALLNEMLETPLGDAQSASLKVRRSLLLHLIAWFRLHLQNFSELKTLPIIQEVMG